MNIFDKKTARRIRRALEEAASAGSVELVFINPGKSRELLAKEMFEKYIKPILVELYIEALSADWVDVGGEGA